MSLREGEYKLQDKETFDGIMRQVYDQKAGPSQAQTRSAQAASRWRRQIFMAALIVAVLILGYVVRQSHYDEISSWFWRLNGQNREAKGHETSRGSQYLLGVGKADITGLEFRTTLSFD